MIFSPLIASTQMEADGSRLSSWCLSIQESPSAPVGRGKAAGMASGQQFQRPRKSGDAASIQLDLQRLQVIACVSEHFTEVAQQPEAGDVGGGMELAGILLLKRSAARKCVLAGLHLGEALSRSSARAAPAMAAANSTPVPSRRLSNNLSPVWSARLGQSCGGGALHAQYQLQAEAAGIRGWIALLQGVPTYQLRLLGIER